MTMDLRAVQSSKTPLSIDFKLLGSDIDSNEEQP